MGARAHRDTDIDQTIKKQSEMLFVRGMLLDSHTPICLSCAYFPRRLGGPDIPTSIQLNRNEASRMPIQGQRSVPEQRRERTHSATPLASSCVMTTTTEGQPHGPRVI